MIQQCIDKKIQDDTKKSKNQSSKRRCRKKLSWFGIQIPFIQYQTSVSILQTKPHQIKMRSRTTELQSRKIVLFTVMCS
jgi:hypothetical protein